MHYCRRKIMTLIFLIIVFEIFFYHKTSVMEYTMLDEERRFCSFNK